MFAVYSSRSRGMARRSSQSLRFRSFLFFQPTSARWRWRRLLYSRHFAVLHFQSKQTPPPLPPLVSRTLSHRNGWRSLLGSFILRHHLLAAAENVAHQTLLSHCPHLHPATAALLPPPPLDSTPHPPP